MKGLKFDICRHEVDQEGRTHCLDLFEPTLGNCFCHLFEPILPRLSECFWAIQASSGLLGVPYPWRDEDYLAYGRMQDELEGADAKGYYPPGTLFPKASRFLLDDQKRMVGVRSLPAGPEAVRRFREVDESWVLHHADYYFTIFEGAWEMFARQEEEMRQILSHAGTFLPKEHMRWVDMSQRDAWGLHPECKGAF